MRLVILSLLLVSSHLFAGEITTGDLGVTKTNDTSTKKFGISLRRDLNLQSNLNSKVNYDPSTGLENSRTENSFDDYDANSLSISFMDHIYRDVYYDVSATYTRITTQGDDSTPIEMGRLEFNIHEKFHPLYSLFAGINLNEFYGAGVSDAWMIKPGYQIGLQRDINESFKIDLRYWMTQNYLRDTEEDFSLDIEQSWSSLSLGLIYTI